MVAVSVIIPCYNREQFIGDAIKSVLSQSFSDFEIIVVDDGSTDRSVDVVRSFESDKVTLIEFSNNMGISAARNAGLRESQSDFAAFLDSDDIMHPRRLEMQVQCLGYDRNSVICGSYLRRIDEQGNFLGNVDQFSDDDKRIKFNSLLVCPFHFTTIMVRKLSSHGTMDMFDESLEVGEDYDYMRKKVMSGRANLVKDYLTYCREHSLSKSNVFSQEKQERYHEIFSRISLDAMKEIGFNTDGYTLSILRDKIHTQHQKHYRSLSEEKKNMCDSIQNIMVDKFLKWYDGFYENEKFF
ncbi:glycosyltransferase family 2 protein (plasmid) [Azospirillum sp. TSA2s]|uniref:glycosyltransferase family 2 protein n=1 Tax=Azospirillum sp. TSA2s TaxID=709810 RepID=UPI0010AA4327|nr:glycosyltransferase family 2 protein [Azospirillum sp. TSA2s]QCG92982.1 glycosyltransferase family 2 protein [Azospirillum sp. TSA2s]